MRFVTPAPVCQLIAVAPTLCITGACENGHLWHILSSLRNRSNPRRIPASRDPESHRLAPQSPPARVALHFRRLSNVALPSRPSWPACLPEASLRMGIAIRLQLCRLRLRRLVQLPNTPYTPYTASATQRCLANSNQQTLPPSIVPWHP